MSTALPLAATCAAINKAKEKVHSRSRNLENVHRSIPYKKCFCFLLRNRFFN